MTRRSYGTGALLVRADRNGRETWYGKWWHDGRQIKRRLGLVRAPGVRGAEGTLTRSGAEQALRDAQALHATEAERTASLTPGRRFDDLADAYLDHLTMLGRKNSTISDVRGHLVHWLRPHFAETAVEEIEREHVRALVQLMIAGDRPSGIDRTKPLNPKTMQNVIGNLSAIFRWAEREGWRRGNPCDGVDLPKPRTTDEIKWLDPDDVRLLAANAVSSPYQHLDRVLYVVAAMTGLRQGELLELRWRDVDWTAGAIRVRRSYSRQELGTPKSRRSSRSVPMADDVAAMLEDLSRQVDDNPDSLVFPHPLTGEHLAAAQLLRRMRKALRSAGLDETFTFHGLRHSFATRMAGQGVPMRVLQEWMGHTHISTTERYADYAPMHDERALVQAAFARGTNRGTNLSGNPEPDHAPSERTGTEPN